MRLRGCAVFILPLLAASLSAQASPWYPLDTGRFWVYSSPGGGSSSATVEAPEPFGGSLVHPVRWESGPRDLLSLDETGRVFQHASTGAPDGSYVVFEPPWLRMDSELAPGHEWATNFVAIEYSSGGAEVWRGQGSVTFRVIAIGSVTVPAGTFEAAEVLVTRVQDPLPLYTFRDWYSQGVGWIRRTDETGTSVLSELQSYGPVGVPVEVMSWGAIKLLY